MAKKSKSKSASTKAKPSASKAEKQQKVEFAKANNVTTPFFSVEGGKIFRTSDGKAYPKHRGFFKDGGARDWSNVTQLS